MSTLGGKHLVEHTWWNTVLLMSVRTLPVTAACLYEQNSACYQVPGPVREVKNFTSGKFTGKKADFSLGLARLLDTRGSSGVV